MPTMKVSAMVAAPVEKVWKTIVNLNQYVSRLQPHTLSLEIVPPGPASVGQKIHAFVRAGSRKVEVFSEITEVVPEKKVVETHVPNDFFRRMVEVVTLESIQAGTLVNFTAEYEPRGFRAKILALIFARRAMKRNFTATLSNLKKMLESQTTIME